MCNDTAKSGHINFMYSTDICFSFSAGQLKSFNISPSGYIDRTALVGRSSSNVSDSSVKSSTSPPPLPATDPPKRALPVKKRRSRTEDEDGRISGENVREF